MLETKTLLWLGKQQCSSVTADSTAHTGMAGDELHSQWKAHRHIGAITRGGKKTTTETELRGAPKKAADDDGFQLQWLKRGVANDVIDGLRFADGDNTTRRQKRDSRGTDTDEDPMKTDYQ